jgi:hypothetical protein
MNPLVRQFFEIVEKRRKKTPLIRVGKKAGIHYVTMNTWRRTGNPTVPNLQAALNAVGHELVIRKIRKPTHTGENNG